MELLLKRRQPMKKLFLLLLTESFSQPHSRWFYINMEYVSSIEEIQKSNLLFVGHYNKIELNMTRPWERFKFYYDILPFGNMLPQETEKIWCELSGKKFISSPQTEQEWIWNIDTEQVKYKGIITNTEDPAKHPFWWTFTMDQKRIIAKYHQNFKATKIKTVYGKQIFKG